ncbi:FtsK/SpoIIIE-like protein [Staphylococcus phage MVC_VPHSA1]|uniref:FtsK/SpoIIIE-like protein n=1 Tax=Staphylococcus phage MVC_VPHSA1 TaxID=3088876 RepID=A0ABZ0QZY8_9CAUD|nr:FtsK/SpoIIIE-like protein [Staphylococcus phage MVC_VPHSA1]
MIFEAASTMLMGGISLYAYLKQNGATNDQQRIQKLFTLSGLNVKHGGKTYTAQLVRKNNMTGASNMCTVFQKVVNLVTTRTK